jgi:hypothetical protein
MQGEAVTQDIAEMAAVTNTWLRDVGRLLQWAETVIEHSQPLGDAPADVKALVPLMLPMIRQCRAQVPTSEMMEAWLRSVADSREAVEI